MTLMTAHRILISTAMVFFLFYAIWELVHYSTTGHVWALLRSLASLVVSIGFAIYLRSLKRFLGP